MEVPPLVWKSSQPGSLSLHSLLTNVWKCNLSPNAKQSGYSMGDLFRSNALQVEEGSSDELNMARLSARVALNDGNLSVMLVNEHNMVDGMMLIRITELVYASVTPAAMPISEPNPIEISSGFANVGKPSKSTKFSPAKITILGYLPGEDESGEGFKTAVISEDEKKKRSNFSMVTIPTATQLSYGSEAIFSQQLVTSAVFAFTLADTGFGRVKEENFLPFPDWLIVAQKMQVFDSQHRLDIFSPEGFKDEGEERFSTNFNFQTKGWKVALYEQKKLVNNFTPLKQLESSAFVSGRVSKYMRQYSVRTEKVQVSDKPKGDIRAIFTHSNPDRTADPDFYQDQVFSLVFDENSESRQLVPGTFTERFTVSARQILASISDDLNESNQRRLLETICIPYRGILYEIELRGIDFNEVPSKDRNFFGAVIRDACLQYLGKDVPNVGNVNLKDIATVMYLYREYDSEQQVWKDGLYRQSDGTKFVHHNFAPLPPPAAPKSVTVPVKVISIDLSLDSDLDMETETKNFKIQLPAKLPLLPSIPDDVTVGDIVQGTNVANVFANLQKIQEKRQLLASLGTETMETLVERRTFVVVESYLDVLGPVGCAYRKLNLRADDGDETLNTAEYKTINDSESLVWIISFGGDEKSPLTLREFKKNELVSDESLRSSTDFIVNWTGLNQQGVQPRGLLHFDSFPSSFPISFLENGGAGPNFSFSVDQSVGMDFLGEQLWQMTSQADSAGKLNPAILARVAAGNGKFEGFAIQCSKIEFDEKKDWFARLTICSPTDRTKISTYEVPVRALATFKPASVDLWQRDEKTGALTPCADFLIQTKPFKDGQIFRFGATMPPAKELFVSARMPEGTAAFWPLESVRLKGLVNIAGKEQDWCPNVVAVSFLLMAQKLATVQYTSVHVRTGLNSRYFLLWDIAGQSIDDVKPELFQYVGDALVRSMANDEPDGVTYFLYAVPADIGKPQLNGTLDVSLFTDRVFPKLNQEKFAATLNSKPSAFETKRAATNRSPSPALVDMRKPLAVIRDFKFQLDSTAEVDSVDVLQTEETREHFTYSVWQAIKTQKLSALVNSKNYVAWTKEIVAKAAKDTAATTISHPLLAVRSTAASTHKIMIKLDQTGKVIFFVELPQVHSTTGDLRNLRLQIGAASMKKSALEQNGATGIIISSTPPGVYAPVTPQSALDFEFVNAVCLKETDEGLSTLSISDAKECRAFADDGSITISGLPAPIKDGMPAPIWLIFKQNAVVPTNIAKPPQADDEKRVQMDTAAKRKGGDLEEPAVKKSKTDDDKKAIPIDDVRKSAEKRPLDSKDDSVGKRARTDAIVKEIEEAVISAHFAIKLDENSQLHDVLYESSAHQVTIGANALRKAFWSTPCLLGANFLVVATNVETAPEDEKGVNAGEITSSTIQALKNANWINAHLRLQTAERLPDQLDELPWSELTDEPDSAGLTRATTQIRHVYSMFEPNDVSINLDSMTHVGANRSQIDYLAAIAYLQVGPGAIATYKSSDRALTVAGNAAIVLPQIDFPRNGDLFLGYEPCQDGKSATPVFRSCVRESFMILDFKVAPPPSQFTFIPIMHLIDRGKITYVPSEAWTHSADNKRWLLSYAQFIDLQTAATRPIINIPAPTLVVTGNKGVGRSSLVVSPEPKVESKFKTVTAEWAALMDYDTGIAWMISGKTGGIGKQSEVEIPALSPTKTTYASGQFSIKIIQRKMDGDGKELHLHFCTELRRLSETHNLGIVALISIDKAAPGLYHIGWDKAIGNKTGQLSRVVFKWTDEDLVKNRLEFTSTLNGLGNSMLESSIIANKSSTDFKVQTDVMKRAETDVAPAGLVKIRGLRFVSLSDIQPTPDSKLLWSDSLYDLFEAEPISNGTENVGEEKEKKKSKGKGTAKGKDKDKGKSKEKNEPLVKLRSSEIGGVVLTKDNLVLFTKYSDGTSSTASITSDFTFEQNGTELPDTIMFKAYIGLQSNEWFVVYTPKKVSWLMIKSKKVEKSPIGNLSAIDRTPGSELFRKAYRLATAEEKEKNKASPPPSSNYGPKGKYTKQVCRMVYVARNKQFVIMKGKNYDKLKAPAISQITQTMGPVVFLGFGGAMLLEVHGLAAEPSAVETPKSKAAKNPKPKKEEKKKKKEKDSKEEKKKEKKEKKESKKKTSTKPDKKAKPQIIFNSLELTSTQDIQDSGIQDSTWLDWKEIKLTEPSGAGESKTFAYLFASDDTPCSIVETVTDLGQWTSKIWVSDKFRSDAVISDWLGLMAGIRLRVMGMMQIRIGSGRLWQFSFVGADTLTAWKSVATNASAQIQSILPGYGGIPPRFQIRFSNSDITNLKP